MGISSVIVAQNEAAWCKKLRFGGASLDIDPTPDASDYLILLDDGTLIGIERKTDEDFLNTLRAKRLFPQLQRLKELTPWAYLVITGDLRAGQAGKAVTENGRETGWNWASVQGALLEAQEIGIFTMQCRETDFEQTLLRICNRDRSTVRVQPARELSLMTEAEQVLSAFPGIGPQRAETLLRDCGTGANALMFLTSEVLAYEGSGIGRGIRQRVRRALGLPDGYCLLICDEVKNLINP